MTTLSPSSARVLAAIEAFWDEHHYSPSVRDIVKLAHLSSTSVAAYHIAKLRNACYISYDDEIARSIVVLKEEP